MSMTISSVSSSSQDYPQLRNIPHEYRYNQKLVSYSLKQQNVVPSCNNHDFRVNGKPLFASLKTEIQSQFVVDFCTQVAKRTETRQLHPKNKISKQRQSGRQAVPLFIGTIQLQPPQQHTIEEHSSLFNGSSLFVCFCVPSCLFIPSPPARTPSLSLTTKYVQNMQFKKWSFPNNHSRYLPLFGNLIILLWLGIGIESTDGSLLLVVCCFCMLIMEITREITTK